jgi:hypothetical protein
LPDYNVGGAAGGEPAPTDPGGPSVDAGGPSVDAGRQATDQCPLIPPSDPGTSGTECSLVGTWWLSSSHGIVSSSGVIQLDADGAYYGGPIGTDLTQTYAYDGAYSLGDGKFNLIYSCGDGTCVGSGWFALEFRSNCSVAILREESTWCTGDRTAVAGDVVLTRQ